MSLNSNQPTNQPVGKVDDPLPCTP